MKRIFLTLIAIMVLCAASAQTSHTLMRGETLEDVATKYGITLDALKQANSIVGNNTYVGMILKIPQTTTTTSKKEETPSKKRQTTSEKKSQSAQKTQTKSGKTSQYDCITLKNGDEIKSFVEKVGVAEIDYKKVGNRNGPTYSIAKADVFMIKYKNGTKDVFGDSEGYSSSSSNAAGLVEKVPDENNAEIISHYQKKYSMGSRYISDTKSKVSRVLVTWGVANTSILSNEDIEISYQKADYWFHYNVVISNKTNHPIFVDKGSSFKCIANESYCYYNENTQASSSKTTGAGMSVNLGGPASALGIGGIVGTIASSVNVGGGSSKTSGTTVGQQRYLVIPPHGSSILAKQSQVEKDEDFEILWDMQVTKGKVTEFTEEESPFTIDYFITYSSDKQFANYTTVNTKLYVKQIFGVKITPSSIGMGDSMYDVISRRVTDMDRYCILGYFGEKPFFNNKPWGAGGMQSR